MKKIYRLLKNNQYLFTIKKGKKVSSNSFSLYYFKAKETKIGISISKKVSKLAVVRNKIKRQINAILDECYHLDWNLQLVIIVKSQILELEFSQIKQEIVNLFKKMGLI